MKKESDAVRKNSKSLFLFLAFFTFLSLLFLSSSASAFEMRISSPRNVYYPHETFQAEIRFDEQPQEKITTSNLILRNKENKTIPLSISLTKISPTHYFAFFEVPDVVRGQHFLNVEDILYLDRESGNLLKRTSSQLGFLLNSTNKGFDYVSQNQAAEGYFNDVKDAKTIFTAALALKNIDLDRAEKAMNFIATEYVDENTSVYPPVCLPEGMCRVIDTVYSMWVFEEFGLTPSINPWLTGAISRFKTGEWAVFIESHNTTCSVNGKEYMIDSNEVKISLSTKNVSIYCSQTSPRVRIVNTYLGYPYTAFSSSILTNISFSIWDESCWGENYKSQTCDYESTAYAVWFLRKKGQKIEPETIAWLKENAGENSTRRQVLNYLATGDAYSKDWLLTNLNNKGFWASSPSGTEPDLYSSALAAYAFRDDKPYVYEKVKSYLAGKTQGDLFTSSLILALLFRDQQAVSSVFVEPGIVYQKDSFLLNFQNYGADNQLKIEAPAFTKLPSTLTLKDKSSFRVTIPSNQPSFNIKIKYQDREYYIPIITKYAVPSAGSTTGISTPSANTTQPSSPSGETQPPTQTPPQTPKSEELLLQPFKDAILILTKSDDISKNISSRNRRISFNIQNQWTYPLHNVTLSLTGNLDEVLAAKEEASKEIKPGEIVEQVLSIHKPLEKGPFSGKVIVSSAEGSNSSIGMFLSYQESPAAETQDDSDRGSEISLESKPADDDTQIQLDKEAIKKKLEDRKRKSRITIIAVILSLLAVTAAIFFLFKKRIIKVQSFDEYSGNLRKR
jgi:hypothetical protein